MKINKQHMRLRRMQKLTKQLKEISHDLKVSSLKLKRLNDELEFYKKRCELLQSCQSTMRDPERTVVCDILANGHLLPSSLDPDRYKIKK